MQGVLTAASELASRVCQRLGSVCQGCRGRSHELASRPNNLTQLWQQGGQVDLQQPNDTQSAIHKHYQHADAEIQSVVTQTTTVKGACRPCTLICS